MVRAHRYLVAILAVLCLIGMVVSADAQSKGKGKAGDPQSKEKSKATDTQSKEKGKAKGKQKHFSGEQLVGAKIKTNGKHVIHQNGKHTVSVTVKNGKIAGLSVKHSEKGDIPVTKYKTTKKMASRTSRGLSLVSYTNALEQSQDLGMTYIGYAYIDDDGYEDIYWFPYEMIYDGDTGAIEYIPIE